MTIRSNPRAAVGATPEGLFTGIGRGLSGMQLSAVSKKELTPEQFLAFARKLAEGIGKTLVSTERESAGLFRTRPIWSGYSIESVESDVQRKQRWLDSAVEKDSDDRVLDMAEILAKASPNRVDITIELTRHGRLASKGGYEHKVGIRVVQLEGKLYYAEGNVETGRIYTREGAAAVVEVAQTMGVTRVNDIFRLPAGEDGSWPQFSPIVAGGNAEDALHGADRDANEARREVGFQEREVKRHGEELERAKTIAASYEKKAKEAESRLAEVKADQKRRADELRAKWKESRRSA